MPKPKMRDVLKNAQKVLKRVEYVGVPDRLFAYYCGKAEEHSARCRLKKTLDQINEVLR
jgi:uncharacterized protein (UPF0128 family)